MELHNCSAYCITWYNGFCFMKSVIRIFRVKMWHLHANERKSSRLTNEATHISTFIFTPKSLKLLIQKWKHSTYLRQVFHLNETFKSERQRHKKKLITIFPNEITDNEPWHGCHCLFYYSNYLFLLFFTATLCDPTRYDSLTHKT